VGSAGGAATPREYYHYETGGSRFDSFAFFRIFQRCLHLSAKPIFADVDGDGLQDYLAGSYTAIFIIFSESMAPRWNRTFSRQSRVLSRSGITIPIPSSATTIPYDLGESAQVEISIFNVRGHRVKELLDAFHRQGSYAIRW
jgi:hypothetical protein